MSDRVFFSGLHGEKNKEAFLFLLQLINEEDDVSLDLLTTILTIKQNEIR
jgi:hypothetical protein